MPTTVAPAFATGIATRPVPQPNSRIGDATCLDAPKREREGGAILGQNAMSRRPTVCAFSQS